MAVTGSCVDDHNWNQKRGENMIVDGGFVVDIVVGKGCWICGCCHIWAGVEELWWLVSMDLLT